MWRKICLILGTSLLFSACITKKPGTTTPPAKQVRQLINSIPVVDRPFLAIFPHATNKLLTLYLDNVADSYKQSTLDLEYLSGNSLKGGRITIDFPKPLPFTQAFLLGSCSSGGKCSFDTNLVSGTVKNKLDDGSDVLNVLKSDFVFVNKGPVTSTDGRVSYIPANPKQKDQILFDTQGLPKKVDGEPAYAPVAISTATAGKISGKLTFNVAGISKALIYDGANYQPIKFTASDATLSIDINQLPWNKAVDIIRDDLKGSSETQQLYLLGPIILFK